MKKKCLLLGSMLVIGLASFQAFAQEIDGFLINVEKNISVNQPVDLEITAVKDGDVVKDYEGTVFIKVEGLLGTQSTIPSNGVYLFTPGDQGKKLFSKGLKITKVGEYPLVVEAITDESINTKVSLIVKDTTEKTEIKTIDIISPTADGIEMGDVVDVIGSCIELPNSIVKIFLNGQVVGSTETDENGEFMSKVSGVKLGENTLEIKAFDLENKLLGKSQLTNFSVEKNTQGSAIVGIEIDPSTQVNKSSKVAIVLKTREDIEFASILIGQDNKYSMEKIAVGEFQKVFLAQKAGEIRIKFVLVENGEEKIYDKNTVIKVQDLGEGYTENHEASAKEGEVLTGDDLNKIGEIAITPVSVDGSTVNITRKYTGEVKKFLLAYGTEKYTLEEDLIVDTNSVEIEQLKPDTVYYFQITPLNIHDDKDGESSDIVEYKLGDSSRTCTVANINLVTKRIQGKNYLVWTAVEGVEKYEIYRSETANSKTTISDMSKIGETQDTKFEYPFDVNTKEEKYAYYAVQAVCKGGQKVQVGNVEKVKTGPFDSLLVILILSGLVFSMYKLYKVSA